MSLLLLLNPKQFSSSPAPATIGFDPWMPERHHPHGVKKLHSEKEITQRRAVAETPAPQIEKPHLSAKPTGFTDEEHSLAEKAFEERYAKAEALAYMDEEEMALLLMLLAD